MNAHLVEIGASFAQTYAPVLDFHGWRVAMLRHSGAVEPGLFHRVERHRNTNEVFLLTAGRADLIICDGDAQPELPQILPMQINVAYNIQQAVWHHVVMSRDAHIVLFERSDTGADNSDYAELGADVTRDAIARFSIK